MIVDIRNPLIKKKTSTPRNPPAKPGTPAWKNKTGSTASALKPLMSDRNFIGFSFQKKGESWSNETPTIIPRACGITLTSDSRHALQAPRTSRRSVTQLKFVCAIVVGGMSRQ